MIDEPKIRAIERPHPSLMKLYVVRALLTGPLVFATLPVLFFRYHTLRYKFDDEGISMRWGILFRREINLTYRRIQDIHVRSGVLQRWLGLADILVQTASGSAEAEMTIEGLLEYEELREYLYTRMRGAHGESSPPELSSPHAAAGSEAAVVALLDGIRDELRATREALARTERRP